MTLMTLYLIEHNIRLSEWKRVAPPEGTGARNSLTFSEKKLDTMVNTIVNAMSHEDAVSLIVKEWKELPSVLRMKLRWALNEAASGNGHRSNNKTKGIIRLDKLLDGNVLRHTDDRVTERDLRIVGGKVVSRQRPINPAVAGASRAHAAFARPAHYANMTPAEKRAFNKQQARERQSRGR